MWIRHLIMISVNPRTKDDLRIMKTKLFKFWFTCSKDYILNWKKNYFVSDQSDFKLREMLISDYIDIF